MSKDLENETKVLSSKLISGEDYIPRKPPYVDHNLLKKIIAIHSGKLDAKVIRTYSRRSTVIPEMVGLTIEVHNGKKFLSIYILETMIGLKLGAFAPTRTFKGHPDKKKNAAATKKKGGQ